MASLERETFERFPLEFISIKGKFFSGPIIDVKRPYNAFFFQKLNTLIFTLYYFLTRRWVIISRGVAKGPQTNCYYLHYKIRHEKILAMFQILSLHPARHIRPQKISQKILLLVQEFSHLPSPRRNPGCTTGYKRYKDRDADGKGRHRNSKHTFSAQ